VVGFVFGLPPAQVIISAAMTSLIFSGLFFQSYGREKEQAKVQQ
jgi:hypothetical protein